ncbi:MAG: methyltransferase domain-containing protein [Dehalococcoidia bacterium]|nr:methyltransferase domain-containing protein [Dehalococcoidia bacterium]MCB9610549.1 methyltransferase domain-containing protein [Polyangiaceae bacterium]
MNPPDRDDLVRAEFTRQAPGLQSSPEFSSLQPLDRIAALLDVQNNETVLDVACGPGIVVEHLASRASEVVGIDLTDAMLVAARERCGKVGLRNVQFDAGNAEALPYDDASFDVTVTRLSFHHFIDPGRVLDEMVRVTKLGGRLAVIDVISSEVAADSDLHNAIEILRDPSHVRMLPKSELLALFNGHGLEVMRQVEWVRPRRFDEWADLTGSPARATPLRIVVAALAKQGLSAGIDLRMEGDEPCFDHHWIGALAYRGDS